MANMNMFLDNARGQTVLRTLHHWEPIMHHLLIVILHCRIQSTGIFLILATDKLSLAGVEKIQRKPVCK